MPKVHFLSSKLLKRKGLCIDWQINPAGEHLKKSNAASKQSNDAQTIDIGSGKERTRKPFEDRLQDLKAYKEQNSHVNVTPSEDKSLAIFCTNIRQARKNLGQSGYMKLTEERISALDGIGFDWRGDFTKPTIEIANPHPSLVPQSRSCVVNEEGSADATGENGKSLLISGAGIHANSNSMIEQAPIAATLGHHNHNGSLYHEALTQGVSAAGGVQLATLLFGSVLPVQQQPKKWVRWGDQEDNALCRAVHQWGDNNFELISKHLFHGTRSEAQCKNRWKKAESGIISGRWTIEEDDIIAQSVTNGNKKWSDIAKRLPGRMGEQVYARWVNILDPDVKKGVWTEAEMRVLRAGQMELGNRWTEIAKRIPGRSENSCKNWWYNQMTSDKRAAKRREMESPEEQQEHQPTATTVTEHDPAKKKIECVEEQKNQEQNVEQHQSESEPHTVATEFGGHLMQRSSLEEREDTEVEENTQHQKEVQPRLFSGQSTEEEDDAIVQSVAASNKKWWSEAEMRILRAGQMELGNKWAEIAKRIPGRSRGSCRKKGGPSTKRTCSHEGCGKRVRKGLLSCARHGLNRYCIVEGCTKVSQKKEHCTRCWNKKHASKGNKSVMVYREDQAALTLCNLANGGNTHTRLDEPGRKKDISGGC